MEKPYLPTPAPSTTPCPLQRRGIGGEYGALSSKGIHTISALIPLFPLLWRGQGEVRLLKKSISLTARCAKGLRQERKVLILKHLFIATFAPFPHFGGTEGGFSVFALKKLLRHLHPIFNSQFSILNSQGLRDFISSTVWHCIMLLILAGCCPALLIQGLRPLSLRGLREWIKKNTTVPQGRHFSTSLFRFTTSVTLCVLCVSVLKKNQHRGTKFIKNNRKFAP